MKRRKTLNEKLGRLSLGEFKEAIKTPIVIVLDNVRSLHNVGSIFRTADAFLIEAVYLCGITGSPPNKEIQKTALGATESVEWKHFSSSQEALAELKQKGYLLYAIEQTEFAILLHNFIPEKNQKLALVFGNEVKGVEQKVVDVCSDVIEIPQAGMKHSLNIAVSVGVVLWDIYYKIKIKN